MSVHLLGIRHHGPGSARHVLEALENLKPDIILVEGPPEGEAILKWVADQEMKPPVALLAYVPDNPKQSVFYPFAEFSPEWQAINYGLKNKIPVKFIDMPLTHKLVEIPVEEPAESTAPDHIATADEVTGFNPVAKNPLSYLAEIAGFEDQEEWWEHHFEIAKQPEEVFASIGEAIGVLREGVTENNKTEKIREAFMRRGIRLTEREMYSVIAVVCGAWHVPALQHMPKQKDDDALLKNLPKTKIETTWIPWTSDRLAFESGYGAGLDSPGWYKHIWNNQSDDGTRWLTYSANVFRQNKIDISSAHIIEAVRLANTLAALRNLDKAGLKELNEATQTVMCMGDEIPMQLIRSELIIGNDMGTVPAGIPQVPLQKDFEQQVKSLRLKVINEEKTINLDLREASGLQKSILFHRLLILDIKWAKQQYITGKGTFKEEWLLFWYPELSIALLEKAPWGNTVEAACNHYLKHISLSCNHLAEITQLVSKALPADLHEGVQLVLARMDELAAMTSDIAMLMDAFIPLTEVSRYGNVRKTDQETIGIILQSIFSRLNAGLPSSCLGIDEEQSAVVADKIKAVNKAVLFLDDEVMKNDWLETLSRILKLKNVVPLIHGTSCKLLYDSKVIDTEETALEFSRALSVGSDPAYSALWIEGFLKDAATVLIFDHEIWDILNNWLSGISAEVFIEVVPLLRRTFAAYNPSEKNSIAQKVKQAPSSGKKAVQTEELDVERAEMVLPIIEKILGF
ncbi:DUF5682 family protein [Pedobacter sp. UBA5917]|jgi:hypothetical protein|uniref:DUF5682 family protein n=1 Tax=Pedobacter sp. UBA5917 TaxID=1947061 RepID=UPI0025DD3B8A|nr:DUF5682 family protein [Pedobacter sp. UBA5917]